MNRHEVFLLEDALVPGGYSRAENNLAYTIIKTDYTNLFASNKGELTSIAATPTTASTTKVVFNAAFTGDVDGFNTVFTMPDLFISGSVKVYLNTNLQDATKYTEDETTGEITLLATPEAGDVLAFDYITTASANTVIFNVPFTGDIDNVNRIFTFATEYTPGGVVGYFNTNRLMISQVTELSSTSVELSFTPEVGDTLSFDIIQL